MINENIKQIKAGVLGDIDDVPAPSPDNTESSSQNQMPMEHDSLPETSYSSELGDTSGGGINYSAPQTQDTGGQGYYPTEQYSGGQIDTEFIHQVVEQIISEKWDETLGKIGNIAVWKEKTNNDLLSIKQEIIRVQERFENLQSAVLGRVKDYDQSVKSIHTEMKALEKVFEKILEPLTSNIKELDSITNELKKHHKK